MRQVADGYFLCAPCAGGHYSFYNEFYDPDRAKAAYIISGAEGVCTDRILRAVSDEARKRGLLAEKIYSAREPSELEALALPELGVYLLDGDYPRQIRAKYPLAVEKRINADDFIRRDRIALVRDEVRTAVRLFETEQRRGMNYLSAVRSVYSDSCALLSPCVNKGKLFRYAARFAAREFPVGNGGKTRAKNRFLSAVTAFGIWTNYETVSACGRVIAIDDSVGVVAGVLIGALKKEAEERGLPCILCRCQSKPEDKAEHLILPEQGLAFFTANRFHPAPANLERTIHISRFLDRDRAADCRFRLNFNKKAIRELTAEAVKAEAAAREIGKVLRSYYAAAVDEEKLENTVKRLNAEIFRGQQ